MTVVFLPLSQEKVFYKLVMKTLIIISAIFFLYSCNEAHTSNIHISTHRKTWDIPLSDSLGNLQIVLPKNFDTMFNWVQYSDCGDGCAKIAYRIQQKGLPIFKENGFIYFPLKDSVEQFTIKHAKLFSPWPFYDTLLVRQFSGKLKSEAYEANSQSFLIDTIMTIGKQHFAAVAFTSFDTSRNTKIQILNAATSIKGNIIEFFFEYRKSYTDTLANDFIKNALEALKTARISNDN